MMNELPVTPGLKPIIDNLIDTARKILTNDGHLAPIAFMGKENSGDVDAYLLQQYGTKTQAIEHIRKVAEIQDVDFVFLILDCWMLDAKHAPNHQAIVERYGSIAASPYGIEAVSFTLETHVGTWSGMARQTPVDGRKKRKTFGEVTMKVYDDVQGNFTSLLKRRQQATRH